MGVPMLTIGIKPRWAWHCNWLFDNSWENSNSNWDQNNSNKNNNNSGNNNNKATDTLSQGCWVGPFIKLALTKLAYTPLHSPQTSNSFFTFAGKFESIGTSRKVGGSVQLFAVNQYIWFSLDIFAFFIFPDLSENRIFFLLRGLSEFSA